MKEFQPGGQDLLKYLLEEQGINPEDFFGNPYKKFHNPFLMKDMDRAVERTKKAVADGEPIMVAGDYDADGVSSTTVLIQVLKSLGADVDYRIPDRREGYGLNKDMIEEAHEQGVKLIITCDNGIACVEQVEYAKTLGVDVIITDHHEPQAVIPDTIVVNPKQEDCRYPFKELAGCAVAWKFCQALAASINDHEDPTVFFYDLIEIVAIGTVADLMELRDENRAIVQLGLESMKAPKNAGLKRLMEEMNLFKYGIGVDTIGFSVGPALNSAGRLASPDDGVELLVNPNPIIVGRRAAYLKELNEERKKWTAYYSEQVLNAVKEDDKVIVHYEPGVPEGIVGIIASRVVEKTGKPTLLMTEDHSGRFLKGSGRSIDGFDLFENIMAIKALFKAAGGHAMACGFSIEPEQLAFIEMRLNDACELEGGQLTPELEADYVIEPHLVSTKLAEAVLALEPTGLGNPKPRFLLEGAEVISHSFIGGDKQTLRLEVGSAGHMFNCIGFKKAEAFSALSSALSQGRSLDLVFVPDINEFRGKRNLQLKIEAFQLSKEVSPV